MKNLINLIKDFIREVLSNPVEYYFLERVRITEDGRKALEDERNHE
jgi:hypothetical protein